MYGWSPNITGWGGAVSNIGFVDEGAIRRAVSYNSVMGSNAPGSTFDFDASRSNSIYVNSGKVYPLSIALNFIIKT